jgi:hypothetical protein
MVLILVALMIVMIFVDVMPISGLICVSAIVMVLCVVVGNHWRNQKVWEEVDDEPSVAPLVPGGSNHGVPHRRSHSRASGAYAPVHKSQPSSGFADSEDPGIVHHSALGGSQHKHQRTASNEVNMVKLTHHPSISKDMLSTSSRSSEGVSTAAQQQPRGQYSVLNASGVGGSGKLAIVTSGESPTLPPGDEEGLTREEKTDNLNEFFEGLFGSIDYSLLLIFMGTFIVVENMASTGIPKFIW